jgi:hypothetical protein
MIFQGTSSMFRVNIFFFPWNIVDVPSEPIFLPLEHRRCSDGTYFSYLATMTMFRANIFFLPRNHDDVPMEDIFLHSEQVFLHREDLRARLLRSEEVVREQWRKSEAGALPRICTR